MTRDILFRGKKSDGVGRWVYGYYIKSENGVIDRILETEQNDPDNVYNCKYGYHDIESGTIGQYTGLKDKNGVKIFEDDTLCLCFPNEEPFEAFVQYLEDQFMVCIYEGVEWRDVASVYVATQHARVTITGNIHEAKNEN
jgi:uncharacterized phage protein (TIGR01671 family)